ncbi:YebC/PmpR family DNA-binding transcriptional regulator [Clostridium grantii]|uniref:Probable transcriptional regulatory protein SAMN02745207_00988 n=1 Tax=Clostridium grantii DSM 8605 TaxID=1121316 RepID=A0A1M5SKA7_9CLOT|nr:YebC/PmpR family DNA-binding transcriptional regulator [Clostridium grantii]SHH39027.1 DNA-binding regulatory protein, YebC/PmpR family [Clostridium grantii DSM 8605]
MSGHSKFSNIAGKKGKNDAKRGKIFTKIGRELALAARQGGSNPDINSKLRDAIAKAKVNNMPNDTVERAIKKGAGELEGTEYMEFSYEGYAPCGVAVTVDVLTDNKNRSAANVRYYFDKYGGNLGSTGCVSYMFQRKGQIIIEKNEEINEDELMMMALEAGAEDFNVEDEFYEIITEMQDYSSVREELEKSGLEFLSAELTMIPDTTVALSMEEAEKVQILIDKMEDDDDIQNVYHNAEFPEGFEG